MSCRRRFSRPSPNTARAVFVLGSPRTARAVSIFQPPAPAVRSWFPVWILRSGGGRVKLVREIPPRLECTSVSP
eukprot:420731-Lingulodinium_polyedra.AAC.1